MLIVWNVDIYHACSEIKMYSLVSKLYETSPSKIQTLAY